MNRIARVCAALAAALLATSAPAIGQTSLPPADLVEQFYRGRAVLSAAVQAAGGAQALRGATALSITFAGDIFNDVQGYSPARIGNPERDGAFSAENHFDFAGGRFAQRTCQDLVGGFELDFSALYHGGKSYNLRNTGKQYTLSETAPSPVATGGFAGVAARWIPALLLQRAQQNFRTLAWIGEAKIAGAETDIVEYSWDEATRVRLYVSREDGLVRRSEVLAPDAIHADEIAVSEFVGGQTIANIWFPSRVQTLRRGARNFDLEVRAVAINPTLEDDVFTPPADYAHVADDKVVTTQVSPRIYEVSGLGGGLYRSQFIIMEDFVVAFDAPLGIPVVRQIIGEIRRVAGDKPIRYVVISHFHSDHAAGVGAYVDAGATIIAPFDAISVLKRYAASRPQFQGQEGFRADLRMAHAGVGAEGFEIVDAGGRRVQVIDFADTPHATHVLTLYDPETRTIMNGDLFSRLVRWNQTFDAFAGWLKRNETPVSKILGTHHEPISRSDLLGLAARSRARADPASLERDGSDLHSKFERSKWENRCTPFGNRPGTQQ